MAEHLEVTVKYLVHFKSKVEFNSLDECDLPKNLRSS